MPTPAATLPRRQACPVPAYTTFGSESATATAPIEPDAKNPSETLVQLAPASSVFQRPPDVPM